jgi:hypothetical protein
MHVSIRTRVSIVCAVACFSGRAFAEVTNTTREIPEHESAIAAKARGTKAPPREPTSDAESRRAREALKREIASFGMVALVKAALDAAPPATTWDRHASLASHAAMWRGVIDDAVGTGELRLSSTGDGVPAAAGDASRNVRTIGGGEGVADVDAFAHQSLVSHAPSAPERHDESDGTGRFTVGERIQRIIRGNFGPFDVCYERGLRDDPSLKGRVAVKLTIDGTGAVATVVDAGSDLPDARVVSCVVRSFATLAFPATGKVVTVVYPLTLRPADKRSGE